MKDVHNLVEVVPSVSYWTISTTVADYWLLAFEASKILRTCGLSTILLIFLAFFIFKPPIFGSLRATISRVRTLRVIHSCSVPLVRR